MPHANVGDLEFYHEHLTADGNEETVLFISGITQNHLAWIFYQADAFLKAGYNCLLVDNRDCGQSLPHDDQAYSIEDMARDYDRLLEQLEISRIHVTGYSMGGLISMALQARAPDRVASLCLCNTFARISNKGRERLTALQQAKEFLSDDAFWSLLGSYVLSWRYYDDPERYANWKAFVTSEMNRQSSEAFARQCQAVRSFDHSDSLPAINCPTLIIASDEDQMVSPRHGQFLAQHIPQAEFALLSGAGHSVATEFPQRFNEVVLKFLNDHRQRR